MISKKVTALGTAILLAFGLAGCGAHGGGAGFGMFGDSIQGSGSIVAQKRQLEEFQGVVLTSSTNINIVIGDIQSVVVHADDNLQEYVVTHVSNGKLNISGKGHYSTRHSMHIDITMSKLNYINLLGSGNIDIKDITADDIKVELTGSGNINANGSAQNLDVSLVGSGNVNFAKLQSKHIKAVLLGSGNMEIHATQSLQARVPGSGDIEYFGNPSKLQTKVQGSGDIHSGE
ncbi:MAG: DUF2807 domain-containing protein [Psychrobium sp.]|nr:DUF2807 domain-containing protein [Psychrobium sp.]